MIDEYLNFAENNPAQMAYVQGRIQNVLKKDMDDQINDEVRKALLIRSQEQPDNILFAEMLLWYSLQQKDFDFALIQAKSIDRRYKGDGMKVFDLAMLSINNEQYDVAIDAFNYIIDNHRDSPFYYDSQIGSLKARFRKIINSYSYTDKEIENLSVDYKVLTDQMGYSPRSVSLRRDYAHLLAFYRNDLEAATLELENCIEIPGLNPKDLAECKIELGDILLFRDEVWDATLLYSQVDKANKNNPTGHLAKYKNAKLSYYIGEYSWAKVQLDVLKAATSKLIANDALDLALLISDNLDTDSSYYGLRYFSKAELYIYQNLDSLALITLDSISMLGLYHPLDDEVLFAKAKIYTKQSNFELADSVLSKIIDMYPYDILADNALFMQAELYDQVFEDKDTAMQLYQNLMINYPGSLFTTEARKRFRKLRGDNPNS